MSNITHIIECLSQKRSLSVRVMVCFVIWCVARLPIAVPDFHEVDHHDDSGQTCLYHDHLTRWHGEQPHENPDHQAFLHWHWLIPGFFIQEHDENGVPADDGPAKRSAEPFLAIMPDADRQDAFATFLADSGRPEGPLIARDLTTGLTAGHFRLHTRWPDLPAYSIGFPVRNSDEPCLTIYTNLRVLFLKPTDGVRLRLRC